MKRRAFILGGAACLLGSRLLAEGPSYSRFQFCLLKVGRNWNQRQRALVKWAFEVQKRCNIPIESNGLTIEPEQVISVSSPFFIISGSGAFPEPSVEAVRQMRSALGAGGLLLFDDASPLGDTAFYDSALAWMAQVYPEMPGPRIVPSDHALFQSYYLLKKPRGRLNKTDYLEGWTIAHRTTAFFSHNDLLGALEADQLGAWRNTMEIGGGFRRELCFRLAINLCYYALTINYKKDRAFPPIIERRRRQ